MKVLLTGFEPFGGASLNHSWEAVKDIPNNIGGIEIIKLQVPVVIYKCVDIVLDAAQKHEVDAIICVGESGATDKVNIELVATNWLDMRIPDNDGEQVEQGFSYADSPDAHFASIAAAKAAKILKAQGSPVILSLSAGDYVCNHIFYGVRERQTRPAGFIHVPAGDMKTEVARKCLVDAIPLLCAI